MELVYLWVEDYKNIQNQGFNFSPKFNCDYNSDSNELTIDENNDYIENFFGDNINVTAIVGKNGSGKSSVLFQEEGGVGQEWSKGFKIIFQNNTLELLEPFRTFWDEEQSPSPYVKIFKIINKTKYKHKKISIYTNIDLDNLDEQYVLGESEDKKIDDDYSIYFDGDILKYLDTDKLNYHMYGSYGFSHKNPNNITSFIQEDANFDNDENLIDFVYKVNTDTLENEIKNIIKNTQYDFLEFLDFEINFDENNFLFKLSHGQRSLVLFLTLLLDKINELDRDLIIYLDEPDLALHPQWQKQFINILIGLLKKIKNNFNFHLVVTTHSPFLLSDIPKQNIIFLDKDADGKCIVVDGLKEKKQTFGANIHTLLSDSFFMEDGLMGKFAKGKIDEAIKYLNQEKLNEKELKYCEQIISIIGEPIVKNQLQRMLDSKRLKKIDEIDKLYEEIELIKHRIEIMRKND